MAVSVVAIISGIAIASAAFSYIFEKFEAHRKYTIVLEGKLNSQEKIADERLKTTEDKLKAKALLMEVKLKAETLLMEEKLKAQKNLADEKLRAQDEKLRAQDEKLRAQENLYEVKLKSLTSKSATPSSI
jgi:hypothetical protein